MEIFSEVKRTNLPEMKVVSASRVSENPEEEVIGFVCKWLQARGYELESRRGFGFDIPVSEEDKLAGKRGYEYWITIEEELAGDEDVKIKTIAADNYAFLRIREPFADPFERIGEGWKLLAGEVKKMSQEKCSCGCESRYCLEEVVIEGDVTYMDIYCPV